MGKLKLRCSLCGYESQFEFLPFYWELQAMGLHLHLAHKFPNRFYAKPEQRHNSTVWICENQEVLQGNT